MSLNFDQYAQEGNHFINQIQEKTGRSRAEAAHLLRSTLHALRNRISLEESLHLNAQLPMFLKAVYVDNLSASEDVVRSRTYEDFVVQVMAVDEQPSNTSLGSEEKVKEDILAVFQLLNQYVSEGEWKHISDNLPEEITEAIFEEIV